MITKPLKKRVKARFYAVLSLGVFAMVLLGFRVNISACSVTKPSERVGFESEGANESVVYSNINKTRIVEGIVKAGLGPLPNGIIDVYRLKSHSKSKRNPMEAVFNSKPSASYSADEGGRFCIADLDDGLYVLRVGTIRFAFKHLYIWVEKRRRFRKRNLVLELNPGT
jgi:hypothetical protein